MCDTHNPDTVVSLYTDNGDGVYLVIDGTRDYYDVRSVANEADREPLFAGLFAVDATELAAGDTSDWCGIECRDLTEWLDDLTLVAEWTAESGIGGPQNTLCGAEQSGVYAYVFGADAGDAASYHATHAGRDY